MQVQKISRALNIDNTKDYTVPLKVETSVEYDLPSHIYPPKGSKPILMIHPAYLTPARARKITVTDHSPSQPLTPTKPLAALQLFNQRPKSTQSKSVCSCGITNCIPKSAKYNGKNPVQNITTQRRLPHSVENNVNSTGLKLHQPKVKRKLADQNLQNNYQSVSNMEWTNELLSWSVGGRCLGSCCQPRLGSVPHAQTEFLAPGLPPSLTRTPTRGSSSGSPKLRARTRRAVANSTNLPEYLGSARSLRNNAGSNAISGSLPQQSRSRTTSVFGTTPELITTLDMVRAQVLTPRSLFASQHQHTPMVTSILDTVGQCRDSGCSVGHELSLAGFSSDKMSSASRGPLYAGVDSGFSTPVDDISDNKKLIDMYESSSSKSMDSLSLTSSSSLAERSHGRFSSAARTRLPWPAAEFAVPSVASEMPSSPAPSPAVPSISTSSKALLNTDGSPARISWMTNFDPLATSLTGVDSLYFPSAAPHYIPQPIWNLAY